MTLAQFRTAVTNICLRVNRLPLDEQEAAIRIGVSQLLGSASDAGTCLVAEAIVAARPCAAHIVLLIHGIRTHAAWAEMVGSVLRKQAGVQVVPLRYGYFDVLKFLCPIGTRRAPVSRIVRELRDLRAEHPNARFSAIAHSFGTYALVKALDELDLRLYRVVFCGCIVDDRFRRARYAAQLGPDPVLNDCGSRDIWPILAKSLTWGYGPSGTFGFGTAGVYDRFHPCGHCDYFDREFVSQYWVPFIKTGRIRESDWSPQRYPPPYWQSLLSVLPVRWLILAMMGAAAVWLCRCLAAWGCG